MPGMYTVRLTVNGNAYTQPLQVVMDPRVQMTEAELKQQYDLSARCYQIQEELKPAIENLVILREVAKELLPKCKGKTLLALQAYDKSVQLLLRGETTAPGPNMWYVNQAAGTLFNLIQDADMPVTQQAALAAKELDELFGLAWSRYQVLIDKELAGLNIQLKKAKLEMPFQPK